MLQVALEYLSLFPNEDLDRKSVEKEVNRIIHWYIQMSEEHEKTIR
jgi:hypothetical protein